MGFLGRTFTGIRQGVGKWFAAEADPEVILEQTLWDLEKKLIQMRRAIAQAVASFKRADRQRQEALITVQRWQHRAQMALTYGDEELAKQAIARSQSYQTVATRLTQQGQEQQQFIAQVRENLHDLEDKVNHIKMQKEMYVARIRTALAQQQLQQLQQELAGGHLHPAIANLESELWQLEAENQLVDSLEAKFIALERQMHPHE